MKIKLMIMGHPDLNNSIANKKISEEVQKNGIEVRDLTSLYPDFNIDVETEQKIAEKADVIIFQYPLYWGGMPPILKQYIDKVWQYGWAFGGGNYSLEGKTLVPSVTVGSPADKYIDDDDAGVSVSTLCKSLKNSAAYVKMNYVEPIVTFSMMPIPDMTTKEEIESRASFHSQTLLDL